MMFFSVMSSPAPYSNVEVDLALKVLREEFLCLVISNAIHNIPEELDNSMNTDDTMVNRSTKSFNDLSMLCIKSHLNTIFGVCGVDHPIRRRYSRMPKLDSQMF